MFGGYLVYRLGLLRGLRIDSRCDIIFRMLTKNEIFLLQLNKLGSEILKGRNLRRSLQRALETARQWLGFDRVYLFALDHDRDLLGVMMAVGKYSFVTRSLKWPKDTMGGPTYVLRKGRSLLQHGLQDKRVQTYYPVQESDREVLFAVYKLGKFGAGDILLVPVRFRGRVIAILGADKLKKHLTAAQQKQLEELASQIGWAIENARLRQENEFMLNDLEKLIEQRTQEIKEIQAQLIHSERLAAMGELVAGITHEIKNPLTGIVGFTDMLHGYLGDNEAGMQVLEGLRTSVNHLQNVVQNFLSFAKRTQTAWLAVDINQAVADALALTGYNLRRRGIQIDTRLTAELPRVKGDKNQLMQVLTNIILNAEQAMSDKGLLKISTQEKRGKIKIEIADNGVGIAPENMENLFRAFFTTKGGQGTGLGLSVSRNIVQAHGGAIRVKSALGKGTTFIISLPVSK